MRNVPAHARKDSVSGEADARLAHIAALRVFR